MKKIILQSIVFSIFLGSACCIALLSFSCERRCDFTIVKPEDVKPIDWESYNNVYDVFWNYHSKCNKSTGYPTVDTIKVYGWIDIDDLDLNPLQFELISNRKCEYTFYNRSVSVSIVPYFIDAELRKKLETSDLSRKCYVKGALSTGGLGGRSDGLDCCFAFPGILLYSIDDIYFEKEKE